MSCDRYVARIGSPCCRILNNVVVFGGNANLVKRTFMQRERIL